MPCTSPIKVSHGEYPSMVRCGRCRYCRVRRKQQWVGRLRLELLDHFAARFITLTYQEDPGTLDPEDLQLFMKRYRYYNGPCRFFAVGEYGDKGGRGHWHAIIYGHAQRWLGPWPDNKAWPQGFSYDGSANEKSIGYVAGYTMKMVTKDRPNITRMSLRPGIGMDRLEKMGATLAQDYFQDRHLAAWPASYRLTGRRYPICEGGLRALQRGFIEAGGLPPVEQTPDERRILSLDTLGELGTRLQSQAKFNNDYITTRSKNGAARPSTESF